MKVGVAVIAMVLLAGCGPDVKLGPGKIIQADSDLEYRQDNGWVYDTGRSSLRAKDLSGQHCDRLEIYMDYGSVKSLNGVNCYQEQDPRAWKCLLATPKGWEYMVCN
jgi:hypothetical protein